MFVPYLICNLLAFKAPFKFVLFASKGKLLDELNLEIRLLSEDALLAWNCITGTTEEDAFAFVLLLLIESWLPRILFPFSFGKMSSFVRLANGTFSLFISVRLNEKFLLTWFIGGLFVEFFTYLGCFSRYLWLYLYLNSCFN